MSNSNAMAFEDYGYEADQYEKYGMDMTNGYGEEYQSPPEAHTNDNNYKNKDNNFLKKIKCNNINSNFNGVDASLGSADPLGVGAESIQYDASANWFGNGQAEWGLWPWLYKYQQ